jgi:hypothetical protein
MNWLEDRKLSAPILEENVHYYRNLIPSFQDLTIYEEQTQYAWKKDYGDIEFLKNYFKGMFTEEEFFEKCQDCYNKEFRLYLDLDKKCFTYRDSAIDHYNFVEYTTPNKTIEELIKMYEETKELIIFNPVYSRHLFQETDILSAYNKPFIIKKFNIYF